MDLLPLNAVFWLLLNQSNTFQYVGDIIDPAFLPDCQGVCRLHDKTKAMKDVPEITAKKNPKNTRTLTLTPFYQTLYESYFETSFPAQPLGVQQTNPCGLCR